MRVALVALICGIVFPPAAHADLHNQPPKRPKLTAGPIVALHISSFRGDSSLVLGETSLDIPPQAWERGGIGLFGGLRFTDAWGLRVEATYTQRGATNQTGGVGGDILETTLVVDEIAVAALAIWEFPYDRRFRPRVFAGAEVGFILDADLRAQFELSGSDMLPPTSVDETIDLPSDPGDVDVSAVVGIGMGFPVGRRHLVLDVRYSIGVIEVIDDQMQQVSDGIVYTSSSLRSQALSLAASFEF